MKSTSHAERLHSASSALFAPDTEFADTAETTVSTACRPPHEWSIDGQTPLHSDLIVFPIVTLHRQLSRTASSNAARASHSIRRNHFKHRINRLSFIAWIVYRWLKPSLPTSTCIFDRHPPPSAQQKQPLQHCSRLTLNSHQALHPSFQPLSVHRTSALTVADELFMHLSTYPPSSIHDCCITCHSSPPAGFVRSLRVGSN